MSIGRIAWRPRYVGGGELGPDMKQALADKYEDGDAHAVAYSVNYLGKEDVPWLEEVRDNPESGDELRRDAVKLIDAIREHEEIKICNEVAD